MKTNVQSVSSKMKKLLVLVLTVSMVLTNVVSNQSVSAAAKKSKLNKTSVTLLTGAKKQLTVKNVAKKAKLSWKSSNKKVATVSTKGVVKAKAKGTTKITCAVKAGKKATKLTCKVTVLKGATKITILKKSAVKTVKVGTKVDLNRKLYPKSSNDKTTWKSSNTKIAKPNKKGQFTAKKAGTVTITAVTLSGAKDTVKIKVVSDEVTVATQGALETALASNCKTIHIDSADAITLTIPAGNYAKKALVVDLPNGDVKNDGVFASVTINKIKASTWFENAVGNVLTINAMNARVVVGEKANTSIVMSKAGAKLALENNGTVKELKLDAKVNVTITGSSKVLIKVVCNAEGIEITSSVPLDVTANKKIVLTLNAGAEGSVIRVANKDCTPTLYGTVTATLYVGDDKTGTKLVPTAKPVTVGGGNSYYSPSGTPATGCAVTATGSAVVTVVATGSAVAVSGEAVSGSAVKLAKYDGTKEDLAKAVKAAEKAPAEKVNKNGEVAFKGLEVGHYVAIVTKKDFKAENVAFEVKKDSTVTVKVYIDKDEKKTK